MIPISAAFLAHLAQPAQTVATIWKVTLTNGDVYGFTDHDRNIDGNAIPAVSATGGGSIPGGGNVTYLAASGYTRTDIATGSKLEVDNLEVDGVLVSPAITEADLHAGLWDFAAVEISIVNWNDLSMGRMVLRKGTIGDVTIERGSFKAELRGLNQAYTRIIGELTSPACRNNLFDLPTMIGFGCRLDPAPFTVEDVPVTGAYADDQTFFASSLSQPGPPDPIVITAVTKANPGRVTLATALTLPVGSPITIYGCTGMTAINGTTIIRNPAANNLAFDLGVDTTSYPAYGGGGLVTQLGGGSGYFDFGVVTWVTGDNAGLQMEVRSYVPGQIVLQLPMPYAIQVGDTFDIRAGCDKSQPTCHDRFDNVINFRGEPFLPGVDKIAQVGKQN